VAAEICYGVDPLLLAAVIDRESLGGDALKPKGPAGTGDGGHGRGLGQIDDRSHASFLAAKFDSGAPLWQDPTFNVLYAAKLLRKNLDRFGEEGPAVAAYNCGPGNVRAALARLPAGASADDRLAAVDQRTAHRNYASDVLRRRDAMRQPKA
jgi:soluble lytic murein transglycosylase-like protein